MNIARQESRKLGALLLFLLLGLLGNSAVQAQVTVTINGNVANVDIALFNGFTTIDADVSISFVQPLNLTAQNLNFQAQLVSPTDPAIVNRLPAGVNIDPAFPVLITIEPRYFADRIFASGMQTFEGGDGNLSFLNSYEMQVHTHELTYVPGTPYRIFKAPLGGAFFDITADVSNGSVRGRGRSGGFSQFLMVKDTRPELVGLLGLGLPVIALLKVVDLELRLVGAILNNLLRLELAGLLTNVQAALLLLDYTTALIQVDQLILRVDQEAGTGMQNEWRSQRDLVNDAGDIDGLARSLRYSILRLNGGP